MASLEERQQVHRNVLAAFIETGRAPHYTELARSLGTEPERARRLIQETAAESPFSFAWLAPDTDFIAAWAPFSNLPNHHTISVDGIQKWYGQGGLEALAVSQLFPGKEVAIDSRCVQSGEPIRVRMRDSDVLEVRPETAVGHANDPLERWGQPSWAFTGARINLFRSEESVRAWARFDPQSEKAIKPVREWAALLTGAALFTKRLEDDFVAQSEAYANEALGGLAQALS